MEILTAMNWTRRRRGFPASQTSIQQFFLQYEMEPMF